MPVLLKSKYAITHHRVDLIVQQGQVADLTLLGVESPLRQWFDLATELPEVAMPSPFRRAIERILQMDSDAASFSLES